MFWRQHVTLHDAQLSFHSCAPLPFLLHERSLNSSRNLGVSEEQWIDTIVGAIQLAADLLGMLTTL